MFGFYHNEAIELYNKSFDNNKQDISKMPLDLLIKNMITSLKKKYPVEFKDVDSKQVLDVYKEYKLVGDYNFVDNWKKNKDNYLQKGYVSKLTYDFIDDIVTNNDDFDTIIKKLKVVKNSEKLKSKNLKEYSKDSRQLEIFESVLRSSNELWSGSTTNKVFKKPNYCNQQIIISDAATTLIFGAAGPFSVFAGAVSSLVTSSSGDCVN